MSRPDVRIVMIFTLNDITAAKDISDLADGIRYRGMKRSELLFPTDMIFFVQNVIPETNETKHKIYLHKNNFN